MRKGIIFFVLLFVFTTLASAQTLKWLYEYDHPGLTAAEGRSLVYGTDNNLYIAGYFDTVMIRTDYVVISLDTAGGQRWVYRYNGTGGIPFDEAYSVVYGADGNVYSAGYTYSGTNQLAVNSLTSAGGYNWFYESSGGLAYDIAYGGGLIYAAGFKNNDFAVVGVRPNGSEKFLYTLNGSASGSDEARAITYANGKVYAAGFTRNTGTGADLTVVCVDTTGAWKWTYNYAGAGAGADAAFDIAYGFDKNLYVAGYDTVAGGNDRDFLVVSLDTLGGLRWVGRYNGGANGNDAANSIVYGLDNRVYATGYSRATLTGLQFTTACFDTAGTRLWANNYNAYGMGSRPDEGKSVVYGDDNKIYAAGYSRAQNGWHDVTVICYDTTGTRNFVYRYNGLADTMDVANSIIYGPNGKLYVTGYTMNAGTRKDFAVFCIDPWMVPDIWASPGSFSVEVDTGEVVNQTLRIANVGQNYSYLDWTLTEQPPVGWLSADSIAGTLARYDTVDVGLTFDASGIGGTIYYDTLVVASNDPDMPLINIPVQFIVHIPGVEDYPIVGPVEDRCDVPATFFGRTIRIAFTRSSNDPVTIALYDVLGARVYELNLPVTPAVVDMADRSITGLARGVYFLSVSRIDKKYPIKKLVKI